MYQPWTNDERQILCASRAPSDAVAALPHRSRAAVLAAGTRFGTTWPRHGRPKRSGRHPRGPQTLDEHRVAAILATLRTLPVRPDVDTLLWGLRQDGDWRALGDAVIAAQTRHGGAS